MNKDLERKIERERKKGKESKTIETKEGSEKGREGGQEENMIEMRSTLDLRDGDFFLERPNQLREEEEDGDKGSKGPDEVE